MEKQTKNNIIGKRNTDTKNDKWGTPNWVWDELKPHIPKDKIIWEPFYLNGKSGEYLRELGFDVIHEDEDFFENNKGDIIISNPPFSIKKLILKRLKELDKPFILLLPIETLTTKYFKNIFIDDTNFTMFFISKRIGFEGFGGKPYRMTTIFLGYKVSDRKLIYL
jgi:hypothetical protein